MRNAVVKLVGSMLAVAVIGGTASAGWPCLGCRDTAGGTSFGCRACGPRVYGPFHEPVGPIDQCDACARFAGCEGYRQQPEMLGPWQLPPGRGFRPPEACGYRSGRCGDCADCGACGPRGFWPQRW